MLGKILTSEPNVPRFKAKNGSGQLRVWQVYWRVTELERVALASSTTYRHNWTARRKQLPKEHEYGKRSDGKRILSCISSSYQTWTFNRLMIPTGSTSSETELDENRNAPQTGLLLNHIPRQQSLLSLTSYHWTITAKTTVPDVTGNLYASGVPVQKTSENPCYLEKFPYRGR